MLTLCLVAVIISAKSDPPLEPITAPVATSADPLADPPASNASKENPPALSASADAPRHFHPLAVSLDAAVDVPTAGRFPMASTRLGVRYDVHLGPALLGAGLRTGYSYAAGSAPVTDARLGNDPAGYLVAHQIPLQAIAALGARAEHSPFFDVPVDATLEGAVGPELVIGEAHSFGRTGQVLQVVQSFSVGAALAWELGDSFRFGLFGAWDTASLDLRSVAPGVSGDLSTVRLGLGVSYAWGG